MDFKKIEKKWQTAWEKKKIFESAIDKKKKKFFTSNIIPYVNGNVHIGHTFTFSRVDTYARYKRMRGFNVLLAQGFHATGEPIVGAIERLRNGDKSQEETFKLFGASEKDLENFKKRGPEFAAKFWSDKIEESARAIGFSVDWSRKFTLSITPEFSKFVEWQYRMLRKMGYVVQGTHPVIWCPHDKSPTGDHDRLEGEGESPIDYTILKFELLGEKEKIFLPAATLRPETIFGVTNMWVNPNVDYVRAKIGNEIWILSRSAAEKLSDQQKNLKILGEIKGEKLLGMRAREPAGGREIPILPLNYVDPETATGIVMSVPAHAPWDWIGVKEIIADENNFEKYNFSRDELEPVSLIKVEGFGEFPAKEICERMKINSSKQVAELEKATSELYKKEFHTGTLKEICGELAGKKVSEVKQELIDNFKEAGFADTIWEMTGKVVCRCTTKCHVKILENQWFLKYSDPQWKALARDCLKQMKILPAEARNNFENTIEWLKDKACARKSGLGTKLPWDKDWIVETLSDSTIYMAYYTIAGIISREKISASKLTDEVFDFVFLGKGKLEGIAKKSKISKKLLSEMREQFEYWYPLDIRSSGKDLVQNHLTFYIFHHTAIWGDFPERWPEEIAVNGFVNVEGEKMSKSRGNVIPLKDLVEQYGADFVRLNIVGSSEGLEDADWRAENIKSYRGRVEFLEELISKLKSARGKSSSAEKYLQSKFEKLKEKITEAYESLNFRTGVSLAAFETTNFLKWYLGRVGGVENSEQKVLKSVLTDIVKMLAPPAPHICEELWAQLGEKGFVAVADWPSVNKKLIDERAEATEDFSESVRGDVKRVLELAKISKPKKISIFAAPAWKYEIYDLVAKGKELKEIMGNEKFRKFGGAVAAFVQRLQKKKPLGKLTFSAGEEVKTLSEAKEFLQKEFGCAVEIISAENSKEKKAEQAEPGKPGILVE